MTKSASKSSEAPKTKAAKVSKESKKIIKESNGALKPLIESYSAFVQEKEKKLKKVVNVLKESMKIDNKQVLKASTALLKLLKGLEQDSKNLLSSTDEEFIYVEISLAKLPSKVSQRPQQM